MFHPFATRRILRDEAIYQTLKSVAVPFSELTSGCIGYAHSTGLVGWLIRIGTRSAWNHVFVVETIGNSPETTVVIQAEGHGTERAWLSTVDPGGYSMFLPPPAGVSAEKVVEQAQGLLGDRYAFLVIASLVLMILSRRLKLLLVWIGHHICSAVGAICLHAGGWLYPWPCFEAVTPAQLAVAHAAALVADSPKKGKQDG